MGNDLTPVLVTGASGYLGGRVLAMLQAQGCPAVGVTHERCDLLDPTAVKALVVAHPTSTVVHCAAVVPRSPGEYFGEEAAERSVAMVENLVAAHAGPMVFASSMTVYPAGTSFAREEDAAVRTGYGGGKLRAEDVLRAASGRRDVILRFPGLFGQPRNGGVLYNSAMELVAGRHPSLSAILPQWAAMHVDDAAALCIRALDLAGREALVLNAGYEGVMSIPEAVGQIARELGRDPGPLPKAFGFAFDLSRLHAVLGPAPKGWVARMRELAETCNSAKEDARAGFP